MEEEFSYFFHICFSFDQRVLHPN